MGSPAARLTDRTAHGGMIVLGKLNVWINYRPAARAGDPHVCPPGHYFGPIMPPCAYNVLIGGKPAARIGDKLVCGCGAPDVITSGEQKVLIGTNGSSSDPGLAAMQQVALAAAGVSAQAGAADNVRAHAQDAPIFDPQVRAEMARAWDESQAGDPARRHEEGGYIVRNADGSLGVDRWPPGQGAAVLPPARDANGRYNGREVIGEFHTHPNPPVDEAGREWEQGPSPGDLVGIGREHYPGTSYVVSGGDVYTVGPDGAVGNAGPRSRLLGR